MISQTDKLKKSNYSREAVLEEIINNHNHSWFEEILERNKDNTSKIAMSYWDVDLTYGDFFDLVEKYSKAMRGVGVQKGDEIVACLRQCPDYPVIVAAASYIGAFVDLIAPDFDKNYIKEILDESSGKLVFVSDWDMVQIEEPLLKTSIENIIVIPVGRWGKDPYFHITKNFYNFDETAYIESYNKFDNICMVDTFLENAESYSGEVNGNGKLDDVIAVTYSSGSTKKGFHKGIPQRNKTYIIMGRYHDPEVAGIPKMEETRTYACIGTQADTLLLTGVSDTLLQGGTIVLDPIIDEYYFLYSLKHYRGGLVVATRTTWMRALKETYRNPYFKNLKLPYMYVPSEGGEPLTAGEEKALNKWLKDVKAGTAITHTPFSIVKMSVGGGDSEHGSLFLTLFRGYYSFLQKLRGIKEPMGLGYYDFADVKALKEDGSYCEPMEMGRLVANSPISMEKYHNNPEATDKYFIKDKNGIVWGDLGCYGYIDKWEKVYIKGRIFANDPEIKNFQIADVIMQDYKNIMSCEVVLVDDEKLVYVAHVEMQYFKKSINRDKVLKKAYVRCMATFGDNISDRLYFRVRNEEEGFPTLFTTKRNVHALLEEGISSDCISYTSLLQK